MKTPNDTPDKDPGTEKDLHTETRCVTIYGYTQEELADIIKHFRSQLPDFVSMVTTTLNLVTRILLTGSHHAVELLRFKMNRFQQQLMDLFNEEFVSTQDLTMSEVLGQLLKERELTVACAESCTGGNIAHKITQIPGSSTYFLGSVVSYSNEVKANVLKVSRNNLSRFGAVSKQVVEDMACGVASLMRADCAMATSGIAGPEGGTKFKPVGTVWMAVRYHDTTVSELIQFKGDRNQVIESATNHVIFMLIKMLRNSYIVQEEINDD